MKQPLFQPGETTPFQAYATFEDITERIWAQKALQESERKYRELFESSRDGFVIVDAEGRFIDANQSYCGMLGYTLDELRKMEAFYEITPEQWRKWEKEEIWKKQLLKEGVCDVYEKEYICKNGKILPVELQAYAVRNEKGEILYLWAIVRDITYRKRAEEKLRISEEFRKRVFESSRIPKVVMDATTYKYIDCNPAAVEVYKFRSKEDTIGRTPLDVSAPVQYDGTFSADKADHYIKKAINDGSVIFEWKHQRPDGDVWDAEVHMLPFSVGDQQLLQFSLIDITERRRSEQALKQSESAVRKKLQAILEPEGDLGIRNLSDVIDYHSLQSMMEDFYRIANISCAVIDLSGNILVGVGWQDVCTKFHRTHPETNQKCKESDVILSAGVKAGTFKACQCKNNMWDMATPIEIDGRHLGNIFIGQFFYENEVPAYELFRNQARRYGFNEAEYLAAIDRVPRWSPETVEAVMSFYTKLSDMLSSLSYSKIKLSRALAQQQATLIQLSESENKYRTLVENANDIIYSLSSDGIFTYVSPNWTHLLGHEISEGEGHSFAPFVHPDDVSACSEFLRKVFESGEKQSGVEYRVLHKNGQWRWHTSNASAKLGKNGHVTEYIGIARDITYQKQAEEALRVNYHLLGIAGKTAKFGGWSVSLAENKIYWSDEVSAIHDMPSGYSPSVKEWMSFYVPEWRDKITEVFNDCAEKGISYDEEMEIITPAGRRVWVRTIGEAVRDKNGKIIKVHGSFQDITERKQADEALKKSKERLNLIINNINDNVWSYDLDSQGNFISSYISPAGSKILGITEEELNHSFEVWFSHVHPEDVYKVKIGMAEALKKGKGKPFDYRLIAADGSIKWIRSQGKIVNNQDGSQSLIGTGLDITERKQAKEEKEKLQAQFIQAQKMESVGRLAGGVAHDINNKLLIILGYAELLQESMEKSDPNHDFIEEIINAGQMSTNIIGQLLAFARKQIIKPIVCDLDEIVESMLKMIRRLIGEDIDLVWMPGANIWLVKIDRAQIDQILANLCVNARDAISGVGKLTIETGKQTFDEKYCSEHPGFIPGDFVLLAVSDNGCGMDKDTQDNLFEPFFTTKEVGKGTGLGLATIYGIVKQNNGFINVYSEPDQGSTFKIYLPRLVADEDADEAVREKKSAAGGTETILLVEDELSILRMIRMMLKRKGYSVLSAATPAEAVEKAKNHSGAIDLLMTDVIMPEMHGRSLAEKITDIYPDIRLLFMSGYTDDLIAHHGVLDKGVPFIHKPFSISDLAEKLREVLETVSDKT